MKCLVWNSAYKSKIFYYFIVRKCNTFFAGTPTAETVAPSEQHDVKGHAKYCRSVDELVKAITLTNQQRQELEVKTRGQCGNPKWHEARQGRLTASNFYAIHTRIETLKSNPQTDMSKLVDRILNPGDLGHLPQIAHGTLTEKMALQTLIASMTKNHKNVKYQDCGLFVDGVRPYLGASPDGIIECDCHGKALVEIKCPSKSITELAYLCDRKLNKKSAYYGQIQGQMMITGIFSTYFYVYSSTKENLLEVVSEDNSFCKRMRSNLAIFYLQYLAPSLLLEPSSKQKRLV